MKFFLWGFFVAIAHMILTIVLSIYFGLGMTPDATWFMKTIFMQPGAFIIGLVEKNSNYQIHRYLLGINFVFYWAFTTFIIYIVKKYMGQNGARP